MLILLLVHLKGLDNPLIEAETVEQHRIELRGRRKVPHKPDQHLPQLINTHNLVIEFLGQILMAPEHEPNGYQIFPYILRIRDLDVIVVEDEGHRSQQELLVEVQIGLCLQHAHGFPEVGGD